MVTGCPAIGRGFLLVAAVVFGGIDAVAAKEVVAGLAEDGDGLAVTKARGSGRGWRRCPVPRSWCSRPPGAGESAQLVDGVVPDAEVCAGLAGGVGFGSGLVGPCGCGSSGVGVVGASGVVEGLNV